MTQVKKFAFDLSFAPEDLDLFSPKYSQDEKEIFVQKSYDEGYEKGVADTLESIHSRNEYQLQVLAEKMDTLTNWHQKINTRLEKEIALIVKKIAQRLFPATAQEGAIPEIVKILEHLTIEFKKHAQITIYSHPDTAQGLQEKWDPLGAQHAPMTTFNFEHDPSLSQTDLRLNWTGGGLIYQQDEAFKGIYEALDRYGMDTHEHL